MHKRDDMDINSALRNVFKMNGFRNNQEEIIKYIMQGNDALVFMPTGGGKSLCYQLPAVCCEGVSLVVSPLLALIQNQVDSLKTLNINCNSLNSSQNLATKRMILKDLESAEPKIKLLYVTPELLATDSFRLIAEKLFKKNRLSRLIVDEAHCISEWGHDFRESYRKLSWFKEKFPGLQVIGFTATATPFVRNDIIKQLALPVTVKQFLSSFNRSNLFFQVRFKESNTNDAYEDMVSVIESFKDKTSGIIYCSTRNTCDTLAKRLGQNGINAASYHAGLSSKDRTRILKMWSAKIANDKEVVDIVVATISFGMGIDKSNVHFVIHYDMPKTLEGYYQESGRAGRDGSIAKCILYYSLLDRDRILFLLKMEATNPSGLKNLENFQKMVEYCENSATCRHLFLIKYFDTLDRSFKPNLEQICPNKNCDICQDQNRVKTSLWSHLSGQTTHEAAFTQKRRRDSLDQGEQVKFKGFQRASELNKSQPTFKKASFFRPLSMKENQSRSL